MKVAISSGHAMQVQGAVGFINEVDEARRVVDEVALRLKDGGVAVTTFHDDVSDDQSENLNRIVDWHNSQVRDRDVSVHFNASEGEQSGPIGTETLYVTQWALAEEMSEAIASAGELKDRGPKYRDDLFFLNGTSQPAILIEVCFVNSEADVEAYERNFGPICQAIADVFIQKEEVA